MGSPHRSQRRASSSPVISLRVRQQTPELADDEAGRAKVWQRTSDEAKPEDGPSSASRSPTATSSARPDVPLDSLALPEPYTGKIACCAAWSPSLPTRSPQGMTEARRLPTSRCTQGARHGPIPEQHVHYGVTKLLALRALGEDRSRRAMSDIAGASKLIVDHSPDHNRRRQSALLSDLAERIQPGQPPHAATCLLFASRRSASQVPSAPLQIHLPPLSGQVEPLGPEAPARNRMGGTP